MFKKTKKRAFTMVELVIVIAVIAILAAVLIPTFAHLIKAANESADQQAVKNMNTALIAEENINGIPKSPEAAMKVIEAEGYNVENYVAQLDENTLYYDWTENRVLIWTVEDGVGSVTYPSEMAKTYSGVSGIAASWYTLSNAYVTEPVTSGTLSDGTTTFVSAITSAAEGETKILQLQEDLSISDSSLSNSAGAYVTVDLNGHTLTTYSTASSHSAQGVTTVSSGSTLYIKNGTIDIDSNMSDTAYAFYIATAGSSITLENVNVTSDTTILYPSGDAAQVNVINSTLYTTGAYAIGTNAATVYSCTIKVENSTVQAGAYGGTAILVNVGVALSISDSTIISGNNGVNGGQTILCRSGAVEIENSTITQYTNWTDSNNLTSNYVSWSSGNFAPWTPIVLGDGSNTTNYHVANATMTMSGCTVNVLDTATGKALENGRAIYMYGKDAEGYRSELTFDSSTSINGYLVVGGSQDVTLTSCYAQYECGVVTINGTSYSPTVSTTDINSKTEAYKTYGVSYTVSGTTLTKVTG